MRKLKYVKLFENFELAAHGKRTESEILSEDNLENLSSKLQALKLKSVDRDVNYQIEEVIMMLNAWADEKLALTIAGTEGNVYRDKIKSSKDELIDDIKLQLQELLRFCNTGKYSDENVTSTIEGLLGMI